ncbi:uncharacterized protein LOC106868082 [Octopus bimaculoides]|uniref:uncharacterized protein LOC106868082 n=1 Tax=Octopus bimaculoides TaxID=37653 RepID=UPI00071D0FEA|nr:uncharacterized protein LOC106868082 [Octopus bimaculoides]|eukprot:XP_014768683.1 PREDICTED: uncharacterized protein LOC106868082 [Octopus bimaculoides]
MKCQTRNTSRKLTTTKKAFWNSTTKRDEEGMDNKRRKGEYKRREIIARHDVMDKRVYYTRRKAYQSKINFLINSRVKICTFLKYVGLNENDFLKDFKQRIEIVTKDLYNQEFINFEKLELFLEHYLERNILQEKHKTIPASETTAKFRPLCAVVTREAKIEESREEFANNTISNSVIIQNGIITYSRHCMTICCATTDGDTNVVHCPSSVTDLTRISHDTVLATLPFRKLILIINPFSFKITRIQLGLYLVSFLEHSTFIGVEMFGRTIYVIDWENNRIKFEFITKETPTDIAVGTQNKLLLSFSSINRVTCYNLDGQQLFEVDTNSLDFPIRITVYQNHFYVLQGYIVYRISGRGAVTTREIGRKCRHISVGKDYIFVTDYFDVLHIIRTNEYFWPRMSYNHLLRTPNLNNHICIEDCYNITNILPMSTSSILITYRNKKAMLVTDTGEITSQNNLTFLELPSIFCRINSSRFLVFYHEIKGLQYITCPELNEGPLIKVQTDYIRICHIVSNKCLALTTSESINEVHILLIKEDKVIIIEKMSLEHSNVTIAATPINFVIVDRRKNKLVFYSTSGEELFEKFFPFYGYPHHIYSDNIYFYVFFKRLSIVICYDIYGNIKWQWKLPFPVHPHIAVFQGTVYLPDTQLNRVLLYKYHDWPGCCLHTKNPYIRNLNIQLREEENDKVVIAEICQLANGQLVVSDINHDCLLYISNEGDIVSRLSLPSTATDICRWDSHQIGVTLPLQKQLRVIGNLSKTVRSVSLRQPYVRVCKMGEGEIVCYCDKSSHLDILVIKNYNQVEIIHRINIPFFVKSLSIENETLKLLIITSRKAFQYNTSIDGGGHGSNTSCGRSISMKMVPSVLMSQVKRPLNLYGGSIDKISVYLIDNSRMFAINDHNLVVNDLVTNNQLNIYIDLVDVFSRNICASEMLSSMSYLQDLTVSDKVRNIHIPQCLEEDGFPNTKCWALIENNLIVEYDSNTLNIRLFTFDGQLQDSIKFNVGHFINICRWQSNTLVITARSSGDNNKYKILTLKLEFPMSFVIYQTENKYECIASLSNNQLVCSRRDDECSFYVIDIDEIHSTVNEIKKIDIPETLLLRKWQYDDRNYIKNIFDITVTARDIIITCNERFLIFFNSDGQYLLSSRHYMKYFRFSNRMMTTDDNYLLINGWWDKYPDLSEYESIVCLTQTGEYNKIFLNERIEKDGVHFCSINCKGPRFVGRRMYRNELYVEGLYKLNRERYTVCRLQTDKCPVQVKDIDISDEGKTVVCEKANNGNVKIFDEDGELLCHRNVASLVGGVCFTGERNIMATVPKRKEIFQLNGKDLKKYKVWKSRVPYGIIWRIVGNIYCCVYINLTEFHCIKIDGDQLNILESMSLFNLDSGIHFPSMTSEMNKRIFSNELITKLKCSGEGDGGRRRGKSGEIIGKGTLKVRCGNYIAESVSGIDEILVRRLPHRTAVAFLSIPTFDEPVNFDYWDIKDRNSKLIKLDDNVSALMFRESVTLISTTTGDILQHKRIPQQPQQQPPLDICRWTDECFIVVFAKEMMVFNRDLCCLKTIKTEKYYNRIYKYNDNQLVCGGHYIRDISPHERNKKYEKKYYFWKPSIRLLDPTYFDCYYVDVIDINDGTCKYEVCQGKTAIDENLDGDVVVFDVAVTCYGDVVVTTWETEEEQWGRYNGYFVCWYREQLLVRRIQLQPPVDIDTYHIFRPCLTVIGEYVYITDIKNNIYQIPEQIELEKSEDIEKYLLLRNVDNEVYHVLGFDISDTSFMTFGIIPGRQSLAFFHYEK